MKELQETMKLTNVKLAVLILQTQITHCVQQHQVVVKDITDKKHLNNVSSVFLAEQIQQEHNVMNRNLIVMQGLQLMIKLANVKLVFLIMQTQTTPYVLQQKVAARDIMDILTNNAVFAPQAGQIMLEQNVIHK